MSARVDLFLTQKSAVVGNKFAPSSRLRDEPHAGPLRGTFYNHHGRDSN